jgi:hypothetical protein
MSVTLLLQQQAHSNDGKHKGKAYDITRGEALSYGQAAKILSKEVGKK